VARISAVDDRNFEDVRLQAQQADTIYVSPICDPRIKQHLPAHSNILEMDSTLSDESLERLEAFLLFRSRL
jgi:hypothetical protein